MTDCRAPTESLVVFAKTPIPGQVKTRLAHAIGDASAARLAEAFLLDILEAARSLRNRSVLVAFSPASGEPWFRAQCGAAKGLSSGAAVAPLHLVPQPQAGFGERVVAALDEAHRLGAERTVIIGMDSPHLGPRRWESAFAALEDHDVCLGPCEDGGYYLIGLRAPQPALFKDIPWGGPDVADATRALVASLGLSLAELEEDFDVDEVEDLARLAARLEADPAGCPRTREALTRAGIG